MEAIGLPHTHKGICYLDKGLSDVWLCRSVCRSEIASAMARITGKSVAWDRCTIKRVDLKSAGVCASSVKG